MKTETYIKFLNNHIEDCESEIERLLDENRKLNSRVKYLEEMQELYLTYIHDLEDMINEGDL